MLNSQEIQVVANLLDAGIKATGIQVFGQGNGGHLQSAIEKLNRMAQEDQQKRQAAARDALKEAVAAQTATEASKDVAKPKRAPAARKG